MLCGELRLFCVALVDSCPDELKTIIKEIVTDVDCKVIIRKDHSERTKKGT